jgi:hypothetical protein
MSEELVPVTQLRRHIDGMLSDELEADRRKPAPESPHRLDQQPVIPVPVASGSEHEVGCSVPVAVPELRIDAEVQQVQTIVVDTPISGKDIKLRR